MFWNLLLGLAQLGITVTSGCLTIIRCHGSKTIVMLAAWMVVTAVASSLGAKLGSAYNIAEYLRDRGARSGSRPRIPLRDITRRRRAGSRRHILRKSISPTSRPARQQFHAANLTRTSNP